VGRWGKVALALAVAFAVAACVFLATFLAHRGLAQASLLAAVLSVPIALVAAVAAIIAVLPRGAKAANHPLDGIADELAVAVTKQWDAEAAQRGLHAARRLRVSWTAAGDDCFDNWDDLVAAARDGDRPDPDTWAAAPDELAGSDEFICAALDKVPTGRLVILGEPGAGKTMLLICLVQGMLRRRKRDGTGAVPVLVSLAMWDPARDDLRDWLVSRLAIDYPALRIPVVYAGQSVSRGRALLDSRRLLLILDGLDEIQAESRALAIARINQVLRDGEGVVLACRRQEYERVTRPADDSAPSAWLEGAAGVVVQPLDRHEIGRYLRQGARGPDARTRWDSVLDALGTDAPLATTLSTPLTVTLADAIYNPGPEEWAGSKPRAKAAELLDQGRFPDEARIKKHLFDAFIVSAYRQVPGAAAGRTPELADARRWLTFLARQPDLAWWKLQEAPVIPLVPVAAGIICGIAAGIAAATGSRSGVGIGIGLGVGMVTGIVAGLPLWSTKNADDGKRPWKSEDARPGRGIVGGLAGGAVGGLAAGLAGAAGIGHAASLISGLPVALGIGLGVGACTPFSGGLVGGLIGGFVGGVLEGVGLGPPAGIINGLGIALVVGIILQFFGRDTPAARRRWSKPAGIAGGAAIGGTAGLIAGFAEGPAVGLVLGVILGCVSAWPVGLMGIKTDQAQISSPRAALARDARSFWTTSLAAGIAAGAFGFAGGGIASIFEVKARLTLPLLISDGIGIGIASGLVVGLAFGAYHAASPAFLISRVWLSAHRELPWRYMEFVVDAHEKRGVLRQNGAIYEFRHAELRDYLAGDDPAAASRFQPPRPNLGAYRDMLRVRRLRSSV
jgi:hypothetical protein